MSCSGVSYGPIDSIRLSIHVQRLHTWTLLWPMAKAIHIIHTLMRCEIVCWIILCLFYISIFIRIAIDCIVLNHGLGCCLLRYDAIYALLTQIQTNAQIVYISVSLHNGPIHTFRMAMCRLLVGRRSFIVDCRSLSTWESYVGLSKFILCDFFFFLASSCERWHTMDNLSHQIGGSESVSMLRLTLTSRLSSSLGSLHFFFCPPFQHFMIPRFRNHFMLKWYEDIYTCDFL